MVTFSAHSNAKRTPPQDIKRNACLCDSTSQAFEYNFPGYENRCN